MPAFNNNGGLQEIKEFIARVIALPEDGDGFIGIHNTWVPKGHKGGKLPFGSGVIASSPEDFIKKMPKLFTGNNRDIYVCLGTQKRHMERPNRKTGEIQYVPDKHRDNIFKLKSLYIDVDFKGGQHGYSSQADTETAIAKFVVDSALPPPNVVVHTGGGFHLYWVFTRALAVDDWQVLANQLVEATRECGLKCDTGVTIDASRVLRVPNTLNYKYEPARSVKIHSWGPDDYDPDILASTLSKYAGNVTPVVRLSHNLEAFKDVKPFIGFQSTVEMTELGEGCTVSPPIDLRRVYPQCGFIKEALTTEGKDYDNTLWNLTTLLSTFTTQGRGAAHLMGKAHPEYSSELTDKLYDRKELDKSRGIGWPKCSTIKASGAKSCSTCPHFSKGLYPFSFVNTPPIPFTTGSPALQEPVQWLDRTGVDNLPPDYLRDVQGLIYKIATDDDGNNYEQYPSKSSILSDAYLSMPPAMLHFKAQVTPYSEPVQVNMPNRYLYAQSADMTNILADAGMAIDKKAMGEFLVAWVEKLKESRKTFTEHNPFGWAEDKGKLIGFAYAGKLYTPNGEFVAKEAEPELAKQYQPHGDLELWKQAAAMVTNTKRPATDAIIAAAFAAPLVYFTGEEGLYLGIHSEDSGVGKTTAMRTAQSVWANPSAMQRLTDTANSVQQKMGALRHLPIAWDELKGEENLKVMAQTIFDLNSGRSKSRLTTQIQQREVFEWKTLLITASNNSMSDYLNELAKNNDAGFYRLFELQVEPVSIGKLDLADAGTMRQVVNENYGVAGKLYAQFLGQKFDVIKKVIKAQQIKLEKEFEITQAERLWFNVSVVLLCGAEFANTIGLTNIDVPALKVRLFNEIKSMRGTIEATPLKLTDRETIASVLIQYLRENSRRMVVTTDIWVSSGRPIMGAVQLVYPIVNAPMEGLIGQFGQKTRTLRLAKRPLDEWCRRRDISLTAFKRGLEKHFSVAHKQKQSLGTGLPGLHGGQEAVLDFDCGMQDELGSFVIDIVSNPTANVVPFAKP